MQEFFLVAGAVVLGIFVAGSSLSFLQGFWTADVPPLGWKAGEFARLVTLGFGAF